MGRPRNDSNEAAVTQRIGDAFWKLLESNEIRDITVGMIVAEANCNRSTFYYHYRDLEDLMSSLLTAEFLEASLFTQCLFRMATDDEYNIFEELNPTFIKHLTLAVERTDFGLAYGKIRGAAQETWTYLIDPKGAELSPEAEAFIDYYIGGVLCMLLVRPSALANTKPFGGSDPAPSSLADFSRKNYRFMLNEICSAEGIPVQTVLERAKAMGEKTEG